jgi:hypothetical protein
VLAWARRESRKRRVGYQTITEETRLKRSILVCRAPRARKTEDGIEILPWSEFLGQLWAGEIIPIH